MPLAKAAANPDKLSIVDLIDPSSSENQFGALPQAALTYLQTKETSNIVAQWIRRWEKAGLKAHISSLLFMYLYVYMYVPVRYSFVMGCDGL